MRTGRRARAMRSGSSPRARGSARACPGEVQPGAAMVALQEGVPIVPVAIHGSQTWRPGNFQPVSIAWGEPMTLRRAPEGRQGLQGGVGRSSRPRSGGCGTGSSRCTRLGTARTAIAAAMSPERGRLRRGVRGQPARSRSSASRTSASRRSSTGSRRARAAVVHETPGVTRDRKELLCEWNGTRSGSSTRAASTRPTRGPYGDAHRRSRRAPRSTEADLVLFVVDARAGDHAGRRGARGDPPRGAASR